MHYSGNRTLNLFCKQLWKSAAVFSMRFLQRKCFPSALRWGIQSEMCLFKNTFLLFFFCCNCCSEGHCAHCKLRCQVFFQGIFRGHWIVEERSFVDLFLRSAPKNLSTLKIWLFKSLLGCQVLFKIDLYINVILCLNSE